MLVQSSQASAFSALQNLLLARWGYIIPSESLLESEEYKSACREFKSKLTNCTRIGLTFSLLAALGKWMGNENRVGVERDVRELGLAAARLDTFLPPKSAAERRSLQSMLGEMLDGALLTWPVGGTVEWNVVYQPYRLLDTEEGDGRKTEGGGSDGDEDAPNDDS